MKRSKSTDREWLEWVEIQKRATRLWMGTSASEAKAELDRFLDSGPPEDLRRDAFAFRGAVLEAQGELTQAMADLMSALAISREHDLPRYPIETSLAALSQRIGDHSGAEAWCIAALRTAASDPRESGAGALLRLLELRGDEDVSKEERKLIRQVLHQAWHLLRLEGQPDLKDLRATAQKLIEARQGPFSAERPPRPKDHSNTGEDS